MGLLWTKIVQTMNENRLSLTENRSMFFGFLWLHIIFYGFVALELFYSVLFVKKNIWKCYYFYIFCYSFYIFVYKFDKNWHSFYIFWHSFYKVQKSEIRRSARLKKSIILNVKSLSKNVKLISKNEKRICKNVKRTVKNAKIITKSEVISMRKNNSTIGSCTVAIKIYNSFSKM